MCVCVFESEIAQLLMCPLKQSGDKLLPLKAKPNQTQSVISVTVLFGFKAVRLTSDKTSIQSRPHMCAGTHALGVPCSWIRTEELRQLREDFGPLPSKSHKGFCTNQRLLSSCLGAEAL